MSNGFTKTVSTFEPQGFHRLPVTALLCLEKDIVLSGEGCMLCVNNKRADSGSTRLAAFNIFPSQSIHGIKGIHQPGESLNALTRQLIVYGGRFIRLAQIKQDDQSNWQVELGKIFEIDDWILCAAVLSSTSSERPPAVAFVTAHDALWLLKSQSNQTTVEETQWKLTHSVQGSNTILYSAHALWTDGEKILVASGTAFGDIILWSCQPLLGTDSLATKSIHYSFQAHEGSIFGIRISGTVQHSKFSDYTRLLASSSDDRTIRVWDISELPLDVSGMTDHVRGTGFGTKGLSDSTGPPLLSRVMGHLSRIWHVRFLHNQEYGLAVRSFGEDATVITWSLLPSESKDDLPFSMSSLQTLQTHVGKNIWSIAESKEGHFMTGAADGGIAIIPPSAHLHHFSIPITTTVSDTQTRAKDFYKTYTFIDDQYLLTISQQGHVQILSLQNGMPEAIQSFNQKELANYSVVAAANGFAFASGSQGDTYAYSKNDSSSQIVSNGSGKVTGLLAYGSTNTESNEQITALLRSTITDTVHLIILISISDSSKCQVQYEATVDVPTDFVLTSFSCTALTTERLTAFVGSRNGRIGLLDATQGDFASGKLVIQNIIDVHKDAITSLTWHASGDGDNSHLFTTSRDRSNAVFRVDRRTSNGAHLLARVHQLELPFGPNIEGLGIVGDRELLVWGFRNKYFVVYSITKQVEIMAVDCGGVHRTWTFRPTSTLR